MVRPVRWTNPAWVCVGVSGLCANTMVYPTPTAQLALHRQEFRTSCILLLQNFFQHGDKLVDVAFKNMDASLYNAPMNLIFG